MRNFVQSTSTFLAFVLPPAWANAMSDAELDNDGTTFALWMCAALGVVSLAACTLVHMLVLPEKNVSAEEQLDQVTVSKMVRAFAKATTPRLAGTQKWKLRILFFFAVFGIKAQHFAPFAFAAFSNETCSTKFGQSRSQSSMFSGITSLVAGVLGPLFGPLSDKCGKRSLSLAAACSLSMIGFAILAVLTGGTAPVWVASVLFALQHGFGDTVAHISIRFIVGVSRAGVGCGVCGIFGNLIATVVPALGGALLDQNNGEDEVLWHFAGLMASGALCWVMVLFLEGARSLLELPADKIIETSDEDIQAAALMFVVDQTPNIVESDGEELAPAGHAESICKGTFSPGQVSVSTS